MQQKAEVPDWVDAAKDATMDLLKKGEEIKPIFTGLIEDPLIIRKIIENKGDMGFGEDVYLLHDSKNGRALVVCSLDHLPKGLWVAVMRTLVSMFKIDQFTVSSSIWLSTAEKGKWDGTPPRDDPNHQDAAMVAWLQRGMDPKVWLSKYTLDGDRVLGHQPFEGIPTGGEFTSRFMGAFT